MQAPGGGDKHGGVTEEELYEFGFAVCGLGFGGKSLTFCVLGLGCGV